MTIKQLKLLNFRNYSSLNLSFDGRPTILLGNNAAGKSNLLESIYFLSTTKSARAENETELIKIEEEVARVEGVVTEGEDKIQLLITLSTNQEFKKRVQVNRVGRRVVDYVGNFPVVLFSPIDINMVIGSPSLRRWHLDLSLVQVDSQYKRALTLYEQVLTNRNKVLKRIKDGEGRMDELDYWTNELVKDGEIVSSARKAFLEAMNNFQSPLGSFKFEFKQNLLTRDRLYEYSSREIAAGATLIGPHRDDFVVEQDGRNLSHFGSRGEQRTATLAFKLATLEYMTLTKEKRPVLLLDDVFSELDASHRAHIVEVVGRQQTIMATVELENIPQEFLNSARILKVTDGQIIEK